MRALRGLQRGRHDVEVVRLGPVPVRLHRPPDGDAGPRPAVLWIHGGGFVIGNARQEDDRCRELVRALGAVRLGIARMIVITEIATAGGIFAVLALPATGALVLLPLLGVVVQGTSSVLYATIGEYVRPERLSRAFGLFYTVGSVCGIAAPLAFGLLGDRLGVEVAIAALGGTILLTLPLVLALRPERPQAARLSRAP
jgi:MFS family permease